MANQPIPQSQISRAQGGAVKVGSGQVVGTTTVANNITGRNTLKFSVICGATADTNIKIFPFAHQLPLGNAISNTAGRVTFVAPKFASKDEFDKYFSLNSTVLAGIKMSTDNTDNYNGSLLTLSKEPSGKENEVDFDLSYAKTTTGGGAFNEIIYIDPKRFQYIPKAGFALVLSEMKANSRIDFTIEYSGWNTGVVVSAITQNSI